VLEDDGALTMKMPPWYPSVGVKLVPKGGAPITTVLFSSEGAKNQRAPSKDYTFFHYCQLYYYCNY
jgi:hypothetical protein